MTDKENLNIIIEARKKRHQGMTQTFRVLYGTKG